MIFRELSLQSGAKPNNRELCQRIAARTRRVAVVRILTNEQGEAAKAARIRNLNDIFRTTLMGGKVMLTSGVRELSEGSLSELLGRIQQFPASRFDEGNDPYREHDFGRVDHAGTKYFWKIDYYDRDLQYHSEDPSNSTITQRVMTVMRADEY